MSLPPFLKQLFLRSSMIFLVKVIGAFGRIPMFRILGAEGAGLYQMAYAFYGLTLTIVNAGFATTLSFITARDIKQGLRLFYLGTILLSVIGAVAAVAAYLYSSNIAQMFGNDELELAIRSLAPALVIVPLITLIRGFLQGLEYYGYIAVSELIEQTIRVTAMLVLVTLWIKYGIAVATSGATFAAVLGALFTLAFLILILVYPVRRMLTAQNLLVHSDTSTIGPGASLFFKTSFAIMATRLIIPLSDFIDTLIIPHRLQSLGVPASEATAIFGQFSGIATTIVYIPTLITAALSHTLAPKIAADWENVHHHKLRQRISQALRFGWFWGVASTLYLLLYSSELSELLTNDDSLSSAICYMSVGPLLAGLRDISTIVFWGTNEQKVPLVGLTIGAICSSLICYFFIGAGEWQYIGVAIGLLAMDFIAAIWNLRVLRVRWIPVGSVMRLIVETILFLCLLALVYWVAFRATFFFSLQNVTAVSFHLFFYFMIVAIFIWQRVRR